MSKAQAQLAVLTHPDCLQHHMEGHPERPERLKAVMERFHASGLADEVPLIQASPLQNDLLQLVHPASYVNHVTGSEPQSGTIRLDPDTYMSAGSDRAARLAAGACVQATEAILQGQFKRAFCAVRPPGHHTEMAEALGFCLYNSIAIAAEYALQSTGINRVTIVDFDVHHCNGTVDIFKDRPEVQVCSSFQNHFYPHRYLDYDNSHIINVPLNEGTRGDEYKRLVEQAWVNAIADHKPDLILVSAGFDAHREDPLAQINLATEDFGWITRMLRSLADSLCDGRLIATLEGGYQTDALADSVEVHLRALK